MNDAIIYIPLARLVKSSHNVRKTGGMAIHDLAASIAAIGLQQNLVVRPLEQFDGETDTMKQQYEVVAGSRRLAAMKQLVRAKTLKRNHLVPCRVEATTDRLTEISLAENHIREAMHPADQFEAFDALHRQGMPVVDIAARFGLSEALVEQRLKLAKVSPALFALYRDDAMTLEQLMAFTVSDDPAAQEAAWFDAPSHQRSASAIKRRLTAMKIPANDRRVSFVGIDAYVAAGGSIERDLFDDSHQGYLTDADLLERLCHEKMEGIVAEERQAGYAWVEIVEDGSMHYDYGRSTDKAEAGVVVYLDGHGEVQRRRNLLSPQQVKQRERAAAQAKRAAKGGVSDALSGDLLAHKTAAQRAELVRHPRVALTALLHQLVAGWGYIYVPHSDIFSLKVIRKALAGQDASLAESRALAVVKDAFAEQDNRQNAVEPEMLWAYLDALDDEHRLQLLALCLTHALHDPSPMIEQAVTLDMRDWWTPTAATYLARVPRSTLADAVREGAGEQAAFRVRDAKTKADAVSVAERLLDGTGWLPALLRSAPVTITGEPANEATEEVLNAA